MTNLVLQDIVMQTTATGESVKNVIPALTALLHRSDFSDNDKLRLIVLFVIVKGGEIYQI